ncbi:glycosyl transferase family 1 [Paenibacillus agaridevorans]|uniref:Glycosyl transferase family 1 n=1 Tax=Paenibacillus agaridevorans TaxID=171404 RepID=A0A2R5EMX4_9BACL|nr:glycosyltransferase [Paenibacillus agaridevorans]GBG07992.1 glycosyl transferase family 1 [Paenibacillus agaridevorans]
MSGESKVIVHVTETMASGVLKYLQEVTNVVTHGDVQHYILYSNNRRFTPDKLSEILPTQIKLIPIQLSFNNISKSLSELNDAIREIRPDIIHLHSSIAGFFGRILSLRYSNIQFYYTPHGYSFLMTSRSPVVRVLYVIAEWGLSQFKCQIVACSKSEYRYASRLSWFQPVHLIENALKPFSLGADLTRTPIRVIGVGRLEEQKDPLYFIRIVAMLRKVYPEVEAVWVGDGSLKQECIELNYRLQANVIFKGWLSNEGTLQQLRMATCYLQTSKWEGLPYSVLEAMASGLPVVASNRIFHRDLFEQGYNGLLADNEEEFVRGVCEFLSDMRESASMVSDNKEKLANEQFKFVQRILEIYKLMK